MRSLLTFLFTLLVAGTVSAQLSEDFESGLPAGWVAETYWANGSSGSLSSTDFMIPAHSMMMGFNDDALGSSTPPTSGRLITTDIDLTSVSVAYLTFAAYFLDGDYLGDDETAKVLISDNGGTSWTEVANLTGSGTWQNVLVDLNSWIGSTVKIAFEYNDGGGWNFGFCVDDIVVGPLPAVEIELTYLTAEVIGLTNQELVVGGSVFNLGEDDITSFDATWTYGSDTYTQSYSGLSIGSFETYEFSMSDKYTLAAGSGSLKVSLTNINGGSDANAANNEITEATNGTTPADGRKVLVEEATGTWCGWCPRGAVFMEYLSNKYPDHFVGVAVHNSSTDPMTVPEYDLGVTSTPGFTGFPSVVIERTNIDDPSAMEDDFLNYITVAPAATILTKADWNETTGELTVTADANFTSAASNYKLVGVLVEDGVTGTGSGYNQANYYAGAGPDAMGNYGTLPNPVPASQMVYDHVGRELLSSYNGAAGSLPASVAAGETHSFTFSTTVVSGDWNPDNMHIVVILLNGLNRVNNVQSNTIDEAVANASGIASVVDENSVRVFPNPFNESTNVRVNLTESANVTMSVFNATGQQVAARDYGRLSGDVILPWNGADMQSGIYFLQIRVNDELITRKVTLMH